MRVPLSALVPEASGLAEPPRIAGFGLLWCTLLGDWEARGAVWSSTDRKLLVACDSRSSADTALADWATPAERVCIVFEAA